MIGKISDLPVSPNFSVVNISGRYYLISQENGYLTCDLGREIYSYESDSPTGPFVNQTLLYTEESKIGDRYLLTYNAMAHPEFTENNELLVSYNVNDWVDTVPPNICPSQCVDVWTDRMDADSYRPKFFRVPLGLITGTKDENNAQLTGKIYPNPARPGDQVFYRLTPVLNDPMGIKILDISGKLINCTALRSNGHFSAPGVPGIYFIMVNEDGREYYHKLIVIP